MARTSFALLLTLAAAAAGAQGLTEPAPDARPPAAAPDPAAPGEGPEGSAVRGTTLPRGSVLEEIAGVVREVDRKAHRVSIEGSAGAVTLSLDRNTMVYTTAGLGTVLDVVPGAQVRAGRNAEFLAYWIQVRPPAGKDEAPPSTPGQGTGPAGGGAAAGAAEAGAAPSGGTPGTTVGPGPVGPGPAGPGVGGPGAGP